MVQYMCNSVIIVSSKRKSIPPKRGAADLRHLFFFMGTFRNSDISLASMSVQCYNEG